MVKSKMKINMFKNKSLFLALSIYNHEVNSITMNLPKGIDDWFKSSTATLNPLSRSYPDIDPIQYEKKWCLSMSIPNYLVLFLIDLLYKDNKEVMIEDACTGTGELIFYLSKIGYKNFSIIENWCQIPAIYFQQRMIKGNINYFLNNLQINPTVINLCSYPIYPKKLGNGIINWIPDKEVFFDFRTLAQYEEYFLRSYIDPKCELFCSYLVDGKDNLRKDLEEANMVELCTDEDDVCFAFCRKDKYEEFKQKLLSYEVIINEYN